MPAPRRPRIGVDFHTFDGIFQGSRSHLLGLYEAAIAQAPDLDFHLLLADTERLVAEHPAFGAPNVHRVPMPHRNGLVRLAWQLPRLQQQLGLDLFHLQYRLPLWTAGPCVCTIHDVLFETHPQFFSKAFTAFARLSSRDALRRSQALFTVSEYSRQSMVQAYGTAPERITVTHNGVDTQRFHAGPEGADLVQAHGLQPGGYLCIVGRLEPRKNHVNLVQAYARLPKPRPPLVVVGQRDFAFEAVFEVVQREGLQHEVRFLERVGDAELPALIRHSAAFVYPTWAEGFGMPVLEAMACGVPVVTSSTTSLPEVSGDVAFLCPPDDVAALAQAMALALNEAPAARQQRIQRGIERAQQFTWQRSAQALLGEMRRLLARQGLTPG
ncbi:glycosyltransferase family 1 protein [Aquabacterium lacunae]|uniref:Glycosyltransferase family 1 protein n=1 Tax=Aquabacterium lacunae TaxID=2528630 RepID=A0A4Q9H140_9BURK|nr:glycosyltransferase family 1 protein [Aquabacterium lacunae]TBO27894.1 glycosyltransferase family 1 protein [Aquabacterium lacunae]